MNAPAPDDIVFRPVTPADLPMLDEWMTRPHWREWWGDPETELAHVRDMVEGRDATCRPFIFSLGGVPAGYVQAWEIGLHQSADWIADHPWLAELPPVAVGVDLSLADGSRLSRGIGSAVLRGFVAMLQAEGRHTVIIDPDPANARAVAAYAKAGFRPVPHLEGRTPGVLIMQFQQDPRLT